MPNPAEIEGSLGRTKNLAPRYPGRDMVRRNISYHLIAVNLAQHYDTEHRKLSYFRMVSYLQLGT